MKDDGAQKGYYHLLLGLAFLVGALGIIITYPIQKLYSYKNPIWSEELIIQRLVYFINIYKNLNSFMINKKR